MKKLFVAVTLMIGLVASQVHVSGYWGITPREIFDNFTCELVCQNPAICSPGSVAWATLQFDAASCVNAAAEASRPILVFGLLDLNYGKQRIGSCQGGVCW